MLLAVLQLQPLRAVAGAKPAAGGVHYRAVGNDVEEQTFTLADGSTYAGEELDGRPHGHGKRVWMSGDVFVGQWAKGQMHDSRGKYTYASGSVYDGAFKRGRKHGRGVYKFNTGQKYVGQWQNNEMHGKGKYTWPSGAFCELKTIHPAPEKACCDPPFAHL